MRDFEKISFEQFCKDVKKDKTLYDTYKLPTRDSKSTAGYDIYLNEGHIFIKIQNEGPETVNFKSGEAIAQGIFLKYLTTKSDSNLRLDRKSDY